MTFVPKPWQDSPSTATPLSAAALIDLEQRLAAYVDASAGGVQVAGALTATAGRTSTNANPTLRDIYSVKDYGVKGGGKVFTSGAVVSGNTLTDVTNTPFVLGDTGKTVNILGANTSGANFSTTITYISPSQVTLTATPPNPGGATGAYQYGWDETNAVTSAITGVSNLGGGTLLFPPDVYLWSSVTPKAGVAYTLYGATIYQIATGNANPQTNNNALFYHRPNDGTTINSDFYLSGGTFIGEGQTLIQGTSGVPSNQLNVVWLQQWRSVIIRDIIASKWPNSPITTSNCTNVLIEGNILSDSCTGGGRNAINVGDAGTFSGATNLGNGGLMGSVVIQNNIVFGNIPTQGITIAAQNGFWQRCVMANNIVSTTGFCGGAVEMNTWGSGNPSGLTQVIVTGNIFNPQSTASNATAFYCADDGGSPSTDPLKLSDWTISNNYFLTASNAGTSSTSAALQLQLSRGAVTSNVIVESGTRGQCLFTSFSPITVTTEYLNVTGNVLHQTNASPVNSIVRFRYTNHFRFSDNLLVSSGNTNTIGTAHGILVDNNCAYYSIVDNRLITPASCGIRVTIMSGGHIAGNYIYNCNQMNTTSSAATTGGVGILIDAQSATITTPNIIAENYVIDDRSPHQMAYGICVATTSGTLPSLLRNTINGALTGTTRVGNNATAVNNSVFDSNNNPGFSDVAGNRTDTPSTFPVAAAAIASPPASGSAYTSADPFIEEIYWSVSGGSLTSATVTPSGKSALAVGTANPVRLNKGDSWTPTYTGTLALTKRALG